MENDHHHLNLFEAILLLENPMEVEEFLKDLCTPQELKTLSERWVVCQFLDEGRLSYRDISRKTGVSTTTIVRVSRFLNDEPYHGYRKLLNKIKGDKNAEENDNNRRDNM